MHINSVNLPTAILVSVDTGDFNSNISLTELESLAHTAGIVVLEKVVQKRDSIDKSTCVGAGKLNEIAQLKNDFDNVDMLIFDHELSFSQVRNIEKTTELYTIDRTILILDIFAQNAKSREGKIQVELAQQRYRLPRLSGYGAQLAKFKAGVGMRGPGETKLEIDKRLIRERITYLKSQLELIKSRRDLVKDRRCKTGTLTCALVGYTNAGKSTVFNLLTNADVISENKLFSTLDPTARALQLPNGRDIILIDTVGFISRLPHHLVESFKSTLEEITYADLILHVVDHSSDSYLDNMNVTQNILKDLNCNSIPIINVYNKSDVSNAQCAEVSKTDILISAKSNHNIDNLIQLITDTIDNMLINVSLTIPYSNGDLISTIRNNGIIKKQSYNDDGTLLDASVDKSIYYLIEKYINN